MREEGGMTTAGTDLRGFFSVSTLGEIGRRFGWIEKTPDGHYGFMLGETCAGDADDELVPGELHLRHDRELATVISGREEVDRRKAVMVGGGTVGAHVASSLAHEGLFTWTVVDDDEFLPHNAVRHVLCPGDVGVAKARAVAAMIDALLGAAETRYIVANVLGVDTPETPRVGEALAACDVVLDASASVAVSRHLAAGELSSARRTSFFLNPDGTDAVLLVEPSDRAATLRDLEAQYYALVVDQPELRGHLRTEEGRIAYSGACRQATNRMPESRAAALSGLISMELGPAIASAAGFVRVWRTSNGRFASIRADAAQWRKIYAGDWAVLVSEPLMDTLLLRRGQALPKETGGALLGVVDTEAKSIHVCAALSAPSDSRGSPSAFERGVRGLADAIRFAGAETAGQLSYVGEWHTHPESTSALPSPKDLVQLADLARLLDMNGVPAAMLIAGDDGVRLHSGDITGPGIPLTLVRLSEPLS
jgi:hypothetical protein